MSRTNELDNRINQTAERLIAEFADVENPDWAVIAALIHRAVHVAAERKIEYCRLTTYLAEMVGHAHKLMHGDDKSSPQHRDLMH